MDSEEMKQRTKLFAIGGAKLAEKLPDTQVNRAYKGQLSGALVLLVQITGYHEGQSQSLSLFFLELLVEFNKPFEMEINELYKEGEILLKIIVASIVSSR